MNNKTSREISSAKLDSRKYHAKLNEKMYKEYIESGQQFVKTFTEWKESKFGKQKRNKNQNLCRKSCQVAKEKLVRKLVRKLIQKKGQLL